jgi:hypothetical protein
MAEAVETFTWEEAHSIVTNHAKFGVVADRKLVNPQEFNAQPERSSSINLMHFAARLEKPLISCAQMFSKYF